MKKIIDLLKVLIAVSILCFLTSCCINCTTQCDNGVSSQTSTDKEKTREEKHCSKNKQSCDDNKKENSVDYFWFWQGILNM